MHKNYGYSYFYRRKSHSVFRFSVKPTSIRENKVIMSICVIFQIKVMKKRLARKLIGRNSSSINADRKIKNIKRRIFISIITHPICTLKNKLQKRISTFCFSQRAVENSLNRNFLALSEAIKH